MGWFICLSGIGQRGVWRLRSSDGAASSWVAVAARGEGHHQDYAVDFGDHQPVGGWFGGVEHRVGSPDFADVLDAQARVLEQVGGLSVDLEWILFVEQIQIEQFVRHIPTVIQTDTNILLVGDLPAVAELALDDNRDDSRSHNHLRYSTKMHLSPRWGRRS
jgi:hypothetical protein